MENNSETNQNPPPSYNDGMNFNNNQVGDMSYYNIPYFRFWDAIESQDQSALNQRAESMVNLNYIPPALTSVPSNSANYITHSRNDGQTSNEVSQLTSEQSQINGNSNSETSSPASSATLMYTLPSSSRSIRSHSENRSRRHRGETPYNLRSRSISRIPSTDYTTDTPNRSNHNLHLQSGGVMTSNYPNCNAVRNLYNTGQATGSEKMFGQSTNTIHYTPYKTNTNSHPKKRFQIPETPPNLCQSRAMDLTTNPYVQSNEPNLTSSHPASSSLQHHEAFLNTHQHYPNTPENAAAMVLMSFQRPSDQNSTSFVQDRCLPQWLNEHCIRNYSQQPTNQEIYTTLQPESHDSGHRTNLNALSLRQMTPVQRPSSYTMVTPPPYVYPTYPVAPSLAPAITPVFNHINYSYNNYTQNRYDCRRQSPIVQRSASRGSAASARNVTTGETVVRRGRTTFSPAQTASMEREFLNNAYLNKAQRDGLAETLGVTEKQVKVWFQNRRGRENRKKAANGGGEATGRGIRGGGQVRGRRRGRKPKNPENIFISSTRYQEPEITYIEEYTCRPEMRPERPASVIILDEGQDTSSYEETPNRIMTSNQTFNPRRFLEFSSNGNNQENPANRLVASSNATDFSSAQAANVCESTSNGLMTRTVDGMLQENCTNVQDKSDSENRFENRRKIWSRKNIFHQDSTQCPTEQARTYIRNQNSPSNDEISTFVTNCLYPEPAYANSSNENQMHSSNDIEKLENLTHSNQYFESNPFCNSLRKLQESLLVNNEVSTDNCYAVSSNQTTCTPESLTYTWRSQFSEFPNAIVKKDPEYLDDGKKSSKETSSQIINPFRIIANEYFNPPTTSSGTNVDISSSTDFSTPCITDFGSSSNINLSATSATNFVTSSSANFDASVNINFDSSSSTNFVSASSANFCTPSNANLDYEQNYNLATQTNSIYGQNSKTEKDSETYQIDGQDQQPSLMSLESEMQNGNILDIQSHITVNTVTDLLSNTALDTIYEMLEAKKESEKFGNIPNLMKNVSLNLPGEGLGLLNNTLSNVENNEEMQTGSQSLINPYDIKSEANEQPSSPENLSEVINEIYGNVNIKEEPPDDYKVFGTPHNSSYKTPLKIILSKNKKNDWSSSLRHKLSRKSRKNSGQNNSTNGVISTRDEERTSSSGNSDASASGSSFSNSFHTISQATRNSMKNSTRDEERSSSSGNSDASASGSSFINPFHAISRATRNPMKKTDKESNGNLVNSGSFLETGFTTTNSSPISN